MAEDMTRFTRVDEQIDPRIFTTFLDAANALEDLQSVKRLLSDADTYGWAARCVLRR